MSFRRLPGLWLVALAGLAIGCSGEVKIGAVISETGAVGSYGQQVKRGIDLAVDEVNAAGGANGSVVSLIYKDDATNEDTGERVAKELIEVDGVDMIIGAVSSTVTLRIAPLCEQAGVLLLSPSASAPAISQSGDYIYRNYPSDILEGTSMARFAKDQGFEKVVVFALDNAFGNGLAEVFTKEYEGRFRSVVETYRFPIDQTGGFEAMIDSAKAHAPEGIYIVSYDQALAGLLREMADLGLKGVRMATSSTPDTISDMASGTAENLIFPRPGFDLESHDPIVVSFIQAYREKYGSDPDSYAAHGYDALKIFAAAIDSMGSSHPDNIKIGLSQLKDFQGAAGITGFDKNGDVVRYPRLFVIHDGRPMPYEQFKEQGLTLASAAGG